MPSFFIFRKSGLCWTFFYAMLGVHQSKLIDAGTPLPFLARGAAVLRGPGFAVQLCRACPDVRTGRLLCGVTGRACGPPAAGMEWQAQAPAQAGRGAGADHGKRSPVCHAHGYALP